jgi:hypothetical protein
MTTTVEKTGFQRDTQGIWISKDPEAVLTYVFDWQEWLPEGDTVTVCTYTVQARANDPEPLVRVTSGIQSGTKTFVKLSGGQVGKIYTVTAQVTTNDGLEDRRNFRVKVENRSA